MKILLGSIAFASAISFFGISEKENKPTNAEKNYTQYCSSCHGERVVAFVDRQWNHGKTKAEIINSITNGYQDLGMPTWKGTLKTKEIEEIADLIVSKLGSVDQYQFENKITSNHFSTEKMKVVLDTIATDLDSPWGMAQLPDNSFLITDRAGKLYHVDQNKNKTEITGIPETLVKGQGGTLDLVLHPNFKENGWIYMSYSKFRKAGALQETATAIVRGKIKNNQWVEQEELFVSSPYANSLVHYGSRITFDKNGKMYFSVGERGMEKVFPQETSNDNGKIHRLNDDGTIPSDNPFVGKDPNKFHQSIYSYGHRNPQGLTTNPFNGEIWETEHGPRGGDEINIIQPSKNYGWPVITYGINYNGKPVSNISAKEGMEQPINYWIPSIGPSGLSFVNSDKYPAWQGNLMVGSLRFKYLNRCEIKNGKVIHEEKLFPNLGRMRNVYQGRDGYLYIAVEQPGMVFRVRPE